jgi:hypothetical protein
MRKGNGAAEIWRGFGLSRSGVESRSQTTTRNDNEAWLEGKEE